MASLAAEAEALRGEIRGHKAAIRRHRAALSEAKTALDALEAECAARGIKVVVIRGEGKESHGRREDVRAAS